MKNVRNVALGVVVALWASLAQAHVIEPLFPLAEVTHTAAQSGLYSDPATWGGAVPGSGAKVHIPDGRVVTVDSTHAAAQWIYVQGWLVFSRTVPTQLSIETLGIAHGGRLDLGSAADPIVGVSAILQIQATNVGPIDHAYDPLELSRGLVVEGDVTMHGAVKTPFVAISTIPARGAMAITLDAAPPTGWAVGDELVMTATDYGREERSTIASINGQTLNLSSSIQNLHTFPAGCVDCRLHVANLTRNVIVRSDPAHAGSPIRQGHVSIMSAGQTLAYVRFADLGRTTVQPVNDPIVVNGVRDPRLMPLCGLGTENVRGRYAVHFHMAGIESARSFVLGSVVTVQKDAGFKLGFTNHESNVSFRDNVSLNLDGSHFFTEEGTESGEFVGNLAIHSRGAQHGGLDHHIGVQCAEQNYPAIWHAVRLDVGFKGLGFWIHGGNTPTVGNIASGHSDTGFNLWPRVLDYGKSNTYHLRVPVSALGNPSWTGGFTDIEIQSVPATITDNLAYNIGGANNYDTSLAFENKYSLLHQAQQFPLSPKALFARNRGWNTKNGIQTAYNGWTIYEDLWFLQGNRHNARSAGSGINLTSQGGNNNILTNVSLNGWTDGIDQCVRPSTQTTYTNVTCDGLPYVP